MPYIAVSLVALLGFIALAIDLGMVMVAKTQTQNAADAAAFAAARTLTGAASANTTQATANGLTAAGANTVVGTSRSRGQRHHDAGRLPLRFAIRKRSIRNTRRFRPTTTIWPRPR